MLLRRGRGGVRTLTASWEVAVVLLCALCGTSRAAPWNQDEDLAALGSLDSLLAYEDLRQAVQQAEDAWGQPAGAGAGAVPGARPGAVPGAVAAARGKGAAAWQPAEPDPQLYLLTEYDRGGQGQTRVKRNREAAAAAAAAGRLSLSRSNNGLRRHVRNPSSSSSQRLSIVNPLDVLRQRLLLEIARRRKASVPQSNREMLEGIGKRSWNPKVSVEQQVARLERCLAELGELNDLRGQQGPQGQQGLAKAEDKLARLTLLYRAIEYGNKCDITSDLGDQGDQRQQQQQQQLPSETRPQEQGETNHIRDEQDDWSARQQTNGWSRNTRAASSSNLTS